MQLDQDLPYPPSHSVYPPACLSRGAVDLSNVLALPAPPTMTAIAVSHSLGGWHMCCNRHIAVGHNHF